ncbi:MAG: cation-transporting P-type ATPase [Alphaproteobacteria bacterium]|nr:cation-transporting P-type ATPase [Alphaproteobacteria bacterium]
MKIIGLNSKQVAYNRRKYGTNVVPGVRLKTAWQFFYETFQDKINLILLGMLVLFLLLAMIGLGGFMEPIGIGLVLMCVGIIGTFTKLKAQKYSTNLRNKTAVRYAMVMRNGKIKTLNTADIVVDDVVFLQSGETIPADGYIISGRVNVNNAVLNGESAECPKEPVPNFKYNRNAPVSADDYVSKNLLFSGTTVQSGECFMIVKKIGTRTENAKTLLSVRKINKVKTDLDIKLDKLAMHIARFGYICGIIVVIILSWNIINSAGGINAFLNTGFFNILYQFLKVLIIALTIVVAAVPEGLPLIITLIISQNARKMIKRNVLAKNTHKIPEAGNIQILCTDKTGTLTYGNLIPITNYLGDGSQVDFNSDLPISRFIIADILFNTGAMFDNNGKIVGGTSTQRALLSAVDRNSNLFKSVIKEIKTLDKIPFDSANKFSAVRVERKKDKKQFVLYTGAPEIILEHTTKYVDINGITHKINRNKMLKIIRDNANQAKRVVALAYNTGTTLKAKLDDDLTLVSLVTIRDDIRAEVPSAVARMHKAGIQVIMMTGDILDTARVIGIETGIITNNHDLILTARELDTMTDSKIKRILPRLKVVARAVPKTKLKLVKIAQEMGLCIGMCGDGTNDAPALKRADVGFAMGSGTDVCKEAGDIIIIDDNFVSITDAVLFGRTFIKNITKFLMFQIPINVTLVLLSVLYPVLFFVPAFVAVQILIINICEDSLNSLAFGGEPAKLEYMNDAPSKKGESLLSGKTLSGIIAGSVEFLIIFALLVTPFVKQFFGDNESLNLTIRFALLVLIAAFNGFNVRTDNINLMRGLDKNPLFLLITFLIISGTLIIVSFGGDLFQVTPLTYKQWIVIFGLSILIIPIDLTRKILMKK